MYRLYVFQAAKLKSFFTNYARTIQDYIMPVHVHQGLPLRIEYTYSLTIHTYIHTWLHVQMQVIMVTFTIKIPMNTRNNTLLDISSVFLLQFFNSSSFNSSICSFLTSCLSVCVCPFICYFIASSLLWLP